MNFHASCLVDSNCARCFRRHRRCACRHVAHLFDRGDCRGCELRTTCYQSRGAAKEMPLTYPAAIAFIALDESSPWHMNSNVSNVSVFNVTVALAKVYDRMHPRMPAIVDLISKQ